MFTTTQPVNDVVNGAASVAAALSSVSGTPAMEQTNGFLDFNSLNNFYEQNHVVTVSTSIDENGLPFYKTTDSNALYSTPNGQTTMTFSNCTTPQTPSSIPDIVLTGKTHATFFNIFFFDLLISYKFIFLAPPNLDYLTGNACNGNEFKDLNPTVNASFDSADIANYFTGDSFDLDPLTTDLDHATTPQC